MSGHPDLEQALAPLVDALETLGIRYRIGGSIASSLHGVARATLDVDIVVHMPADAAGSLADAMGEDWYADAAAMSEAVRRGSSFNVIHLPTMLKVDVFSRGERSHDRAAFERFVRERLGEDPESRAYDFFTAEDVILHKLQWFAAGGRVSDRQWSDVVGILRSRRDLLDREYLEKWSAVLGIEDLLRQAEADAIS